jgi:hypothetical protein
LLRFIKEVFLTLNNKKYKTMSGNNANPKIILKRKNITLLIDYCLDEELEFAVKKQIFPDTDWEVEVFLKDVKTAITLGMFLKENKMEIAGVDSQKLKKAAPVRKSASEDKPSSTSSKTISEENDVVEESETISDSTSSTSSLQF